MDRRPGGMAIGRCLVARPVILVWEPTGHGEVNLDAGPFSRPAHGLEHRLGKGFFIERQPTDPQHQDVGLRQAQPRADRRAGVRPVGHSREPGPIHAQRNDRQRRPGRRLSAGSIREVSAPGVEHLHQAVANAGGCADDGVPGVRRSDAGHRNGLPHEGRRQGVNKAHQAVGLVADRSATQPRQVVKIGLAPEERPRLGRHVLMQD